MFDRLQAWWRRRSRSEADGKNTFESRIDIMAATRADDAARGSEGGSIPPNYVSTRIDEGRPRK